MDDAVVSALETTLETAEVQLKIDLG